MKRSSVHRAMVAATCIVFLAGCGQSGTSKNGTATSGPTAQSATAGPASPGATAPGIPADLDHGPRASESAVSEPLVEQGEQLFKDKGCSACHAFGKRVTGPDLAGVSQRRTARWIESQILHPDRMVKADPISRQLFAQFALQMPNQGLTEAQAKAVIEYFKHRDHEGAAH